MTGNYRLDGEPRALYWEAYREVYSRMSPVLTTPGMQLTQDIVRPANPVCLSLISHNELDWSNFDYTGGDKRETYFGLPPGKSAQIDFTISAGLAAFQIDLNMVTEAVLDRPAKASDQLWAAHFAAIESNTGYQVYWVPLHNNPLHVLLVHQTTLQSNGYEPRKSEKVTLTRNFFRVA